MNTAPKEISAFFAPSRELLLLVLPLLLPLSAMAEINSVFTVPPYTLDETIENIEGWELRHKPPHPVFTNPMKAVVIQSPIVNSQQPTALHLQTLLMNRARLSSFGDRLVLETQFALTFNPFQHGDDGGLYFRIGLSDKDAPFVFGFWSGKGGGLYYQGQGGRVIVLPKADVLQNVAYKFTVHADMGAETFRVLVTSPEDKSFRHESQDILFQGTFKTPRGKLGKFCMGNNKPTLLKAYIDYIKVAPPQE